MESAKPVKVLMMNCDKLVNLDEIKADLFPSTHDQYFAVKTEYFDIDEIDSRSKEMSERSKDEKYDVGIFAVHANESRLSINEKKAGIGYAKIYNAIREMTGDKVVVIIAYDSNHKDPTQTISSWARFKISSQFSGEYLDGPKGFVLSWQKHPERCHKNAVHQFVTSVRQDIKESIKDMYKESKPDKRKTEEGSPKKEGRKNENAKKSSKVKSAKTRDIDIDSESDKDIDSESERDGSKTSGNEPDKLKAADAAPTNEQKNAKETSTIDRQVQFTKGAQDEYNAGMTEDDAFKTALRESEKTLKVSRESHSVIHSGKDERPQESRQAVKGVKEGSGHSSDRGNIVGASGATRHVKERKTEMYQRGNGATSGIDEIKEMLSLTVLIVYDRNIQNIDELSLFEMEYSGLEIMQQEFDRSDERFQLITKEMDGAVLVFDANDIPKKNILQSIYSKLSQCTENQVILAFANDNSNMAEGKLHVSEEVKCKVRSKLGLDDSCIDGPVSYVLSWKTKPHSPHKKAILKLLNRKVLEKRDKIYHVKTEQSTLKKIFVAPIQNLGDKFQNTFMTSSHESKVKKAVEDFVQWTKQQKDKLVAVVSWKDGKLDRSLEKILLETKIIEFTPFVNLPSWIETRQEFKPCQENASVACGVFKKKDGNYKLVTHKLEI